MNLTADKSPDLQATFPRGIGRSPESLTTWDDKAIPAIVDLFRL